MATPLYYTTKAASNALNASTPVANHANYVSSIRPGTPKIVRPWEDTSLSATTTNGDIMPMTTSEGRRLPTSATTPPTSSAARAVPVTPPSALHQPSRSAFSTPSISATHTSSSSMMMTPPPSPPEEVTNTTSGSCTSSPTVLREHAAFLQATSHLQARASPSDPWLATLSSCYLMQVTRIETSRSRTLLACGSINEKARSTPTTAATALTHAAIHQHYDAERMTLLQNANANLLSYSCSLQHLQAAAAARANTVSFPMAAARTPTPAAYYSNVSTPLARSTTTSPTNSTESSPTSSSGSPSLLTAAANSYHHPTTAAASYARESSPKSSSGSSSTFSRSSSVCSSTTRLLNPAAVRLLEEWFRSNVAHPYADAAQVRHLATAGGITTVQVRKWMANRRLRSQHRGSSISSTKVQTAMDNSSGGSSGACRVRRTLVPLR